MEKYRRICKPSLYRQFSSAISPPQKSEIEALVSFFSGKKYVCAITGAGISTASGIPDYRGPQGSYRLGHKPIEHSDFIRNSSSRARYWSRSVVGFEAVHRAAANDAHIALAVLQREGLLKTIVTQNVDR
jgi:NAD-dependent SIR2 family protein deacetylase